MTVTFSSRSRKEHFHLIVEEIGTGETGNSRMSLQGAQGNTGCAITWKIRCSGKFMGEVKIMPSVQRERTKLPLC